MISVVIPVYNGEKYLSETIESVINQIYQNWELIIVDDGSTDGTKDIIEHYANLDTRITKIYHEENKKTPETLNTGFANANGDYFTWIASDNIYCPDALESMINILKENNEYSFVYADISNIDGRGDILNKLSYCADDIYKYCVVGACFLYTKEIAQKTGLYDIDMFMVEDYDYWLRIRKNTLFYHLKKPLCKNRVHDSAITVKDVGKTDLALMKLQMKHREYILNNINDVDKESLFLSMCLSQSANNNISFEFAKSFFRTDIPVGLKFLFNRNKIDSNKKIILFGAGFYGKNALKFFGAENVEYFVDNDINKQGSDVQGKQVISFEEYLLIKDDFNIVLACGKGIMLSLVKQLTEHGIYDIFFFNEFTYNIY